MVKILGKAGFYPQKTEGDHLLLRHPDGRTVTVPVKDPEIGPGLMSLMMDQLQMEREDFIFLVRDPKKWRKRQQQAQASIKPLGNDQTKSKSATSRFLPND